MPRVRPLGFALALACEREPDTSNQAPPEREREREAEPPSLLRFDPALVEPGRATTLEQRRALMLERGLKLMTHELTHSFGVRHCIHYDCLMNGANHIEESDAHPMHLCPVCLRKLQLATDFDPVARYEQLAEFYDGHGLDSRAAWIRARLGYLAAAQ